MPVGTETFEKREQTKSKYLCNFLKFNIQADTKSMKSIFLSSNHIVFNSELNNLLGFTKTRYPEGHHRSEKPVMITTTDKVHRKCDSVDGSIVNGIREQILFIFILSAPPGYKIIKEPNNILYKKINKTRLDSIQFFLEDSNHNPVDFNGETLTFTIQIIKIYSEEILSSNNFKNKSYRVGGKHYSTTINIRGDITQNKKNWSSC